ncbi:methyltransferase domain-containing protein [Croceicoccus ponticola]|uniref:Methyltransferase domain-containing protein n=1 Tax=Croceicoccus ponticola TaxID=2217664 RepID=A0A437GZ78_9SPHN|nr:metalloregulator ArsR/SmtB family transcription factor [Croceicoccus ponticola]RVQ67884.1 methyltransferase domain-containing protein [Croceicoccus ponticola]
MNVHDLISALDDPTRLRLLRLLARMELAVGELAEVLDQSQPRISRHVRILTEAGLIEKRKEGSWVFLSAAGHDGNGQDGGSIVARAEALLAAAEAEDAAFAATCGADRARLAAIRAAREDIAEKYFARHADEWDALRSLHSPDGAVEAELTRLLGVADALDDPAPPTGILGRLLDIGTGTGRMAEIYAPSADHVAAIDKSPEMLRIARARLQHLPPARLSLLQGDFLNLPFDAECFDTVLFHQVLHYAQAPERALAEAARVTKPGGRIAIVDFAAHSREDLRTEQAHARLGFTDGQMRALLEEAGFAPGPDSSLSGSELTVRIWTGKRPGTVHQLADRGGDRTDTTRKASPRKASQ